MTRTTMGFAATAAVIAIACSSAPTPDREQAGRMPDHGAGTGLSILRDDDARVSGVHEIGAYAVRFEAATTNASTLAATSVLRVGDATFEWTHDPGDGAFGFDGHDVVVTAEHKAAFVEFDRALMAAYMTESGPRVPLTPHVALLLGQVHWLADARIGMTIPRMTLYHHVAAAGAAADGKTPYNWGRDVNGPWWNVGPACAFQPRGHWNEAWICPYGTWGGGCPNKETRWAVVDGTGGSNSSCHGDHCPSKTGRSGNWDCQGQCGTGCQNLGHNGVYQDCFEHDVCTDWFPDSACDNDKYYAAPALADSIAGWCGGWRSVGR